MARSKSPIKYYSPLRYPGGKSCIFNFVSNLFYENNMVGISYAEPYAGGSGLALRLLFEEYVDKIYINDLDKSIYAFWKSVLDRTDEFCDWIENIEVSVETWRQYKNLQAQVGIDDFELAKSTFFLNRTNISGVIKGGAIGGLEQKGKYKIDVRFRKTDLVEKIKKIAAFKSRIHVSNLDGLDFIKKIERRKEDVFVYLDPPYFQKGADLYMNYYSKKNHENLCRYVNKMRKRWMVSYDNHDFITNLYSDKRRVVYQLSQCASNRVGDEILIFPKNVKFKDSIQKLNSPIVHAQNKITAA